MKRKNKIDQFFENNISKADIPNQAWNTPDDIVWDNILDELQNKEEKKKGFPIYFLLGFCLLLLVLMTLLFPTNSDNQKSKKESEEILYSTTTIVSSSNKLENSKNTLDSIETYSNKNIKINSSKNANKDHNHVVKNSYKTRKNSKWQLPNQVLDHQKRKSTYGIKNVYQKEPIRHVPIPKSNKIVNYEQFHNASIGMIEDSSHKNNDYLSQNLLKDNINDTSTKTIVINRLKSFLFPVGLKKGSELILKPKYKDIFYNSLSTESITNDWSRELGVSHSRYFVNPFTKIEPKNLQRNEYLKLFSSSYKNANIHISSRITQKWAFQSGLYYTQQKINVGFELRDLIYTDSTDPTQYLALISNRFDDYVSKDNNENLEVVFFPTSGLIDGDTLQLLGQLPVELNAFQVPFSFKYEIGKARWKYWGAPGLSLNFYNIIVDSLPVEIFAKDILVSNEVGFTPFSKTLINLNLHIDLGVKYFISKNVNLGLSYRFEPLTKEFSRYEFGVYYRN